LAPAKSREIARSDLLVPRTRNSARSLTNFEHFIRRHRKSIGREFEFRKNSEIRLKNVTENCSPRILIGPGSSAGLNANRLAVSVSASRVWGKTRDQGFRSDRENGRVGRTIAASGVPVARGAYVPGTRHPVARRFSRVAPPGHQGFRKIACTHEPVRQTVRRDMAAGPRVTRRDFTGTERRTNSRGYSVTWETILPGRFPKTKYFRKISRNPVRYTGTLVINTVRAFRVTAVRIRLSGNNGNVVA